MTSSTVVIIAANSAVDVATTVSVPGTAYAGTTVFGAFTYRNDGTNSATGVAYTALIGTPGSCPTPVSFTILPVGVTATHNPATCAVTFTGMPATLTSGQQLDFAFSYTAPVSGTIPLSTTISAGNETLGAPAPNSASANTVIVSPRLTLAKSAAPASYGAVGQTINYSFLVTNVGTASLDGPVTVNDPLVSNESCPAVSTIGDFDAQFDPGEQILCSATYVTTVADLANTQIVNSARAIVQSVASPFDTATLPRVLIDAVNDNFTAFSIDGVTGGTTPTVYSNDTANSSAFAPAAVTPSIVNPGGLTGVSINADGSLNVPPGTSAGSYSVVYRICLVSNPNTCDTATATVAIAAVSAIDAVNNDFSGTPINPTTGGNTATVFTNDRLNGAPFAANEVLATLLGNGGLAGLVLNPSGTLSVPPGTAPGTYYASYRICNALAPAVCDDAQAIIVVSGIDAVNDDFSNAEIASSSGGVTPTVYANDTLAGVPIQPTAITASISNAGGLTGVSINANGTLNVPPGTPAGSYGVTYQICLVANPSVCDSAVATVVVVASPAIDAVNNDYTATPFGAAGGNTPSVYLNDTLSGAAFSASQVTSSIVNEAGLLGVSINPDGTISVPPSAAPGTYNVVYEICSVATPALCDQAIASITVISIDAVNDDFSLDPIDGSSGGTTATLYSNDTLNGSSFLPAAVNANITALGGLPVGTVINANGQVVVPAGTAAGSYTMTYQICAVANPSVCDSATAVILVLATSSPALNVTKTVSPDPVGTNGPATYTITVTNTGSTTTGNITITDQLRPDISLTSFSGANWSCTGPSLVECVYSGTLVNGASTQLQLVVNIGLAALSGNNTARASGGGDPGCPAPPGSAKPRCFGSVLTGTVPVTLSDVEVLREADALVVRFGTASEAGTLAYRVLAEGGDGRRQPLTAALTPGKGASLQPQRYEVRGDYRGQSAVWIVEIAIDGQETAYGPFAVGSRTGERVLSSAIDWAGVRAEQASFRLNQARALVGRAPGSASEVEARVSSSGFVRITHTDLLAQGIDWTGVNPALLQLSRGQTQVPLRYDGPASFGSGSSVAFLAEAVSGSLYTRTAVYRLRVGAAAGTPLPSVHAAPGTLTPINTVMDVAVHAPNREYSFSSPSADPWYALRVLRVNAASASANENFIVSDLANPGAAARIEVALWGGLDFPEGPDHSVRLLLNGTEFATRRFDGLSQMLVAADLPAGLLQNGNNTLTLELVGDTGVYADIVHLESVRVHYERRLVASDNRLSFAIAGMAPPSAVGDSIYTDGFSDGGIAACRAADAGCQAYAVSGLTRPDITVLRMRGTRSEQLAGAAIAQVSGGYELRFASQTLPGDRYFIAPAGGDTAVVAPASPLSDPLVGGPASYLIIAHPSLISGLAPLVAARQAEGFSVRVLDVEDLYRHYSAGTIDPNAISNAIADAWQRLGTRYVLLVGSDSYDYFNYVSPALSLLPTHYRSTGAVVRYAPADSAFADTTGDGLADVAIGRFPVRTLSELTQAIDKTLQYAQASHGRQLLNLSDRDQATLNFAQQMQTIPSLLGGQWTSSSISLRNYASGSAGVAAARADLVSAVNSGKSLLAFFGHSSPSNWTRESLLTAAMVQGGLFSNTQLPTAIWQLGCWGAYFVDPQAQTLAHTLLLQPGGAAFVLGASGLTEVSSDATWMQAMAPLLGTERVGDALRLTQRLLRLQGSEFNDVSVGATLLGDPALRLRQ